MLAETRLKGRYQLNRYPVPHRGMGEVWRARDTLLDRIVIVKTVDASTLSTDTLHRFQREALLTATLEHPGVPTVHDLGSHEGQPYLVMQCIDGPTLTELAAEHHPLPTAWVAAIGAQISSVLMAAHRIGLVHRDLKPSNAIIERSGAVKVLDFGLAVVHDDDRYSRITRTGESPGTIGYMAPEQIRGETTDHRTDLYGLGGTLFHLLTGEPPFDGLTTASTLRHQLHTAPPRPSRLRPDTPEAIDDLVHALLAENPQDRPASAAEVYEALAPLAAPLPPIPGVVADEGDPTRCYAAIVGRQPAARPATAAVIPDAAAEAERLFANGEYRTAARHWRQLVERHGRSHPLAVDWRLRTAQAHLRLGEHDRARHLLDDLLEGHVQAHGADHVEVAKLRLEIGRLTAE